jgi:hypothetical protein
MSVLSITVSEVGVLRVDVFLGDSDEYTKAVEFHRSILPEVENLDKAIKRKYEQPCKNQVN